MNQKILIVDDKQANLMALQQTLAEVQAEVISALSGDEALRLALNHNFALAILDVNMPEMDGYELAEILRNDERTQFTPIIFLTALCVEETDVFKGYEAGAVDYLVKPYNPRILLGKVRGFLLLDQQRKLLHQQQKQLEATNRELEAFSYSVSHDLKAPLRALSGFSEALVEDYGEVIQGEGQLYLKRLQNSAKEMADLIDDLLRLSRSTRAEMHRSEVNLSQMAKKIIGQLELQQPDHPIEISVMADLFAYADQGLMLSVLENLFSNAWKFTQNRDDAHIEFGCREIDGQVTYYVRDNGAGFNMSMADKLFTPFGRLHRRDEYPGTGIGLATVQRIIHRHGGRIWAESEPDRGASFFFQLGEEIKLPEVLAANPLRVSNAP
ncbi:hybrid sensor histidine kinase/response regulator [Dongshaea marina]|uniref:hybrid sensor histidine kinase/response regulator n=1 Tax=Dongshaea marina TaxID=2047966 RepID=UPI000D3E5987|nr:response regulator [Dongshaea marina]